ncbi:MAG: folate-binding protein [Pseudomonadota bacterium]
MQPFVAIDRSVLALAGGDRVKFLQDLVTNDLGGLTQGLVYAALLTPQGKYLSDFFLSQDGERILLDVSTAQAPALAQRLSMYKLRADVTVTATDLAVVQGTGTPPEGASPDPRHPDLGWRHLTAVPDATGDAAPWHATRIRLGVPQSDIELIPNESYILEAGFDRLNGVDFKKGCYVGQEVTARMRHKTALRKGLARVAVTGAPPPAGSPVTRDDKPVGTLYSVAEGLGLAHLRFDRAEGEMRAGDATVTRIE